MGDRIVLMRDGVLQQVDAPEALYARPANLFVAGFIGSPKMNLLPATRSSSDGAHAIGCLGTRFVLSVRSRPRDSGGDVILGLRPEDLRWARTGAGAGDVRLEGRVEVVEPLGSETLITVAIGEHLLVARFPPRTGISSGELVDLAFDPAHVHLFDPGSGSSLLRHDA